MRQRMDKNFQKRFEDRISVVFPERLLAPTEQRARNDSLVKAITEVMAGILKREPTQEELLGLEDISTHKRRRKT